MPFQPNQNLYGVGIGSSNGTGGIYPHIDVRAPVASDNANFPIGQRWIDTVGLVEYTLVGQTSIGGVLAAIWDAGGNGAATTSVAGIVSLSTLGQLETGTAPAGAVVPLANDVFTF